MLRYDQFGFLRPDIKTFSLFLPWSEVLHGEDRFRRQLKSLMMGFTFTSFSYKYVSFDKRPTQTVCKSVCLSHPECVQHQQWISLFLPLQVHPDGLWWPPGPVSVGGECGHDLVSRRDAGCRPGAASSPDAPHTPGWCRMEKDTPREQLAHTRCSFRYWHFTQAVH